MPSNKEIEFFAFDEQVALAYVESKGRYGAPKIRQVLLRVGIACSTKRVQRHMKRLNLCSITVKKYRPQKSNTPVPEGKPNLLEQDFKADTPNKKWVIDITYIHTLKDGWTYLACVLDLCHHKIIGYTYDRHMTAEMATQALKNATLNVEDTTGIIIHSEYTELSITAIWEVNTQVRNLKIM